MTTRIDQLAEQLLRDGHVGNEADARLAAIYIILAAGVGNEAISRGEDDEQADTQ